jgi:penicillin-binding protein 1A
MVGSTDWSERQFNNAVKASVQAGSTAKLPLMIAACESGKTPDSRVVDLPITANWPANGTLGYRGQTTLKEAFASSRNAAAVRLAKEIGPDKVAEVSRRLGIDPGPTRDPGFVLGSYSTNIMTMTSAYAAVANGGYEVKPSGILAVIDGRGQVRADFLTTFRTRIIPEKCVQHSQIMLREVVRNGTGRGAALKRWTAYGKTGTTTGNADAWFIGWSEERVLGIWMGRRRGDDGPALAGAGAPAAYFRRVANAANEWTEHRQTLEERRIATARSERRIDPARIADWFSTLGQTTAPSHAQSAKDPSKDKRTREM